MRASFFFFLVSATPRELNSADLGERPLRSAKDVGFRQHWGELSERQRLKLRDEAGWKWKFPGEPPAYAAWQEHRRAEIMDLYHYQERLDNWVQYVQIRSVRNFTRLGFDVVDAPRELHQRLRQRLLEGIGKGARREMGGKPQGIYGDRVPDFVNHGEGTVLQQLKEIHEQWTPTAAPLKPVTAYGMRVYRRGASLAWHADRVDTHIISSIFHIDHHYDSEDEPWPIEIEAHDGTRHAVALKPGQMLLYESAKCPHGRSSALKGDWYASLFSHFMPANRDVWPYTQQDVWLAVPADWDKPPITHSGSGRWAGAFLTHDSMEVKGMVNRQPKEQHLGARLRIPRAIMHDEPLHYEAQRRSKGTEGSGGTAGVYTDVVNTQDVNGAKANSKKAELGKGVLLKENGHSEWGWNKDKGGTTGRVVVHDDDGHEKGGQGRVTNGNIPRSEPNTYRKTKAPPRAKEQFRKEFADGGELLSRKRTERVLVEPRNTPEETRKEKKNKQKSDINNDNDTDKNDDTDDDDGGGDDGGGDDGDDGDNGDDDETIGEELLEAVEEGAALSVVVLALYIFAGGSVVGLGLMIRRAIVSRSCRPMLRKPGTHAKAEDSIEVGDGTL
jgi:hypothetical protein